MQRIYKTRYTYEITGTDGRMRDGGMRDAGMQACRYGGIEGWRDADMEICRDADMERWRSGEMNSEQGPAPSRHE